jgi:hypothetical protein
MSPSRCIYGYASPVTPNTAPATAVGAVRRGSTINGLTSRNLPGKAERTDTPSPKVVGPLYPTKPKWSSYA